MTRRVQDYPDGYAGWQGVASMGAYISAAGTLLFIYIVIKAFMSSKKAAANPWGEGATTLEWSVSSPPPFHTVGDKDPKT